MNTSHPSLYVFQTAHNHDWNLVIGCPFIFSHLFALSFPFFFFFFFFFLLSFWSAAVPADQRVVLRDEDLQTAAEEVPLPPRGPTPGRLGVCQGRPGPGGHQAGLSGQVPSLLTPYWRPQKQKSIGFDSVYGTHGSCLFWH
jgi:hypothetical protein